MQKYIIYILSIIFLLLPLLQERSKLLEVVFCDVGQGDATLISIGSKQLLIDAGRDASVLQCLENNMPFWDRTIEFLIFSHMDADHIGGGTYILERYQIDFIFMNPSMKKTSDFSLLETAVLRKSANKTKVITTYVGQKIWVSDGFLATVINPQIDFSLENSRFYSSSETTLSDKNSNNLAKISEKIGENNLSIALNIDYKEISILLPGDLESEGELAVEQQGLLNRVVLLKAGHHGSKSSSNPGFLDELQPEFTVVSSGKNNAYSHPHPQVIERFHELGVKIFQTMQSGELKFMSDGHKIWQTL